jgi:hypothetical protein
MPLQSVTPAANDKEQIEPMVQVIEQQSGQRPAGLLADSGYCSEKNLEYLAIMSTTRHGSHRHVFNTGSGRHAAAALVQITSHSLAKRPHPCCRNRHETALSDPRIGFIRPACVKEPVRFLAVEGSEKFGGEEFARIRQAADSIASA